MYIALFPNFIQFVFVCFCVCNIVSLCIQFTVSFVKNSDWYLKIYNLTALISSASVVSPILHSTSTRVLQVTGCLPLPSIHCRRISRLISCASSWYLLSMAFTCAALQSFRSKTPKLVYLVPICSGMLISLLFPGNVISSTRFGVCAAIKRDHSV